MGWRFSGLLSQVPRQRVLRASAFLLSALWCSDDVLHHISPLRADSAAFWLLPSSGHGLPAELLRCPRAALLSAALPAALPAAGHCVTRARATAGSPGR
jgi:hypothetical protein